MYFLLFFKNEVTYIIYVYAGPHFVFDRDLRASVTAVLKNARHRRACYNALVLAGSHTALIWDFQILGPKFLSPKNREFGGISVND